MEGCKQEWGRGVGKGGVGRRPTKSKYEKCHVETFYLVSEFTHSCVKTCVAPNAAYLPSEPARDPRGKY